MKKKIGNPCFNLKDAKVFFENTLSATSIAQDHEVLYLTQKKLWVLNKWTQGVKESYEVIEEEQANKWLIKNHQEI